MAFEIESGTILTAEQLQNHVKIYAGPGAGKTHFLVENVKTIVTNHPIVSQSRSRKVLCITYTNAAGEEIERRLNRFSDSVEVFTIHSFIIEHIIKPFQTDLRRIIKENFNIEIKGNKAITSQLEGLGILHGIDRDEIYKFITQTKRCLIISKNFLTMHMGIVNKKTANTTSKNVFAVFYRFLILV